MKEVRVSWRDFHGVSCEGTILKLERGKAYVAADNSDIILIEIDRLRIVSDNSAEKYPLCED